MRRLLMIGLLATAASVACDPGGAQAKKEGLGKATADITADTRVLGAAEAAVADVLRNPGDCDSVKAALPEANRAIAEADKTLRTAAARATLDGLRAQVRGASQNCP